MMRKKYDWPRCRACGKYIGFLGNLIWHHVSYNPSITVPLHRGCHFLMHKRGRWKKLVPPELRNRAHGITMGNTPGEHRDKKCRKDGVADYAWPR